MATTETKTVHQVLAELKVIDDRIRKAISEAVFVTANKHSNQKIAGKTIAEYKETMKATEQKVNDLMNRKNAMKKAVDMSNATTKVNVCGQELTIVEAITMKNHGMEHKKVMLGQMNLQYKSAIRVLEQNSGEAIEKKAEQYVLSVIQAQPKESKMGTDSDAMKALRKDYIENNTYDLIDPLDILKKIEALSDEIQNFETEIDAALSTSNALTTVTFTY